VTSFVCTVQVPSVDDYFAKAQKLGGTVALPKMPIPGVGWIAYCKDPDGNIFGLHQPDPNAK
jgi:predicted enzyme related to lactoylglutathione lyase